MVFKLPMNWARPGWLLVRGCVCRYRIVASLIQDYGNYNDTTSNALFFNAAYCESLSVECWDVGRVIVFPGLPVSSQTQSWLHYPRRVLSSVRLVVML